MNPKQILFFLRFSIFTSLFSFLLPFARCVGPMVFGYPVNTVSGLKLIFGVTFFSAYGPSMEEHYSFPTLIFVFLPLLAAAVATYRPIRIKKIDLSVKRCCLAALVFLGITYLWMGGGHLYGFYLCALSILSAIIITVLFIEKEEKKLPDDSKRYNNDK
jgi:hypothetical protein